MSFGFGLALPSWQTLSGGFSPASLFAAGGQGVWYQIDDLTTLFQDSAGTTPVTAVEQPVGLMLDKSQGLVLGSELVTNGTFDTNVTGWQAVGQGTLSWDSSNGGRAQITATGTGQDAGLSLTGSISLNANTTYLVGITVTNASSTSKNFYVAFADYSFSLGAGLTQSYTFRLRPLSTGNNQIVFRIAGTMTAGQSFYVDNYSLQALPGNHASQSTDASRPTLRARYNLLTYSEQFDNAAWSTTDIAVSQNSADTLAPDGTQTAAKLTASANWFTATLIRAASTTVVADQIYTHSVYIKAGVGTTVRIRISDAVTGQAQIPVTPQTGAIGTPIFTAYATATMTATSVGNGWFRYTVTAPQTSGQTTMRVGLYLESSGDSCYVWGAQLIVTNDLASNAYQRIAAATDYATGPEFRPYLAFDGSNDSMSTASIDFATVTSDGQARRNLLTYSTAITTSPWTEYQPGNGAALAAITAPDGSATAIGLNDTASGGYYGYRQTPTISASTTYTFSVYVKQGTSTSGFSVWLIGAGGNTYFQNTISWTSGVPTASGWTATAVGNGWYRISYTFASGASTDVAIYLLPAPTSVSAVGSTYFWGAQLELGSTATAFQNIGTDKMSVFAGVRKLSDAARGTVVELTASAAANNGAFHMTAPNAASATFAFESKGTVLTDAVEADNVPAAPVTVALTGLGNISGDSTIIRVNGVQEDIDTGDQGTGNYANAAMFLGARNQASLFFNGRLYSLIVLGRAATAAEIVSTEEYVEQKTFGKALSLVYSDELQTADGDQITMDDGDPIYMTVAYQ